MAIAYTVLGLTHWRQPTLYRAIFELANLVCNPVFAVFEWANLVCTILVLFTPWTVFMPEFATIPLLAGILIIEKVAKLLVSIFLP